MCNASRVLIEYHIDPTLREWAAQTVVGYLVEATLNWLEYGDPARDEEFVQLSTAAVRVAITTWSPSAGWSCSTSPGIPCCILRPPRRSSPACAPRWPRRGTILPSWRIWRGSWV